jgi:hypothetical protein
MFFYCTNLEIITPFVEFSTGRLVERDRVVVLEFDVELDREVVLDRDVVLDREVVDPLVDVSANVVSSDVSALLDSSDVSALVDS